MMHAPKQLKGDAARKWKSMAPAFDLSSPLTVETLAQFCTVWAMHEAAKKAMESEELICVGTNGAPYQSAASAIVMKTTALMQKLTKALAVQIKSADDEDLVI